MLWRDFSCGKADETDAAAKTSTMRYFMFARLDERIKDMKRFRPVYDILHFIPKLVSTGIDSSHLSKSCRILCHLNVFSELDDGVAVVEAGF